MKFKSTYLAATAALFAVIGTISQVQGAVIISEVNSNGTGGDFFELYNAGVTTVDLGGWKWVDNASGTNGGPSFNGAKAYAFNAFTLEPGGVALVVTDASGNATGNTAFASSWGLTGAQFLTFNPGVGNGNGLGGSDLVAVFNAGGTFVTGVNYGTAAVNITQGDNSIVSLAPFNRVGGGISLGVHAGSAGGGAATQSLIWDPTSDPTAPLYTAASSVGLYGSFANAASVTTIGSPGLIPEPSSALLSAFGLLALLRRSRK